MGEIQLEVLAAADPGPLRHGGGLRHGQHLSTGRPSPPRWRAWATLSPCGTTPRCICCWSRGERGSGLPFATACPEDVLDRNWQRLILTHLAEKEHLGVLTGSPITDMKITLLTGRAHLKHTEGGDFRQATYRAVRQGLHAGGEHPAGALVRLPAGGARRLRGPGHDGHPADGRPVRPRRRRRGKRPSSPAAPRWPTCGTTGREVAAYTRGLGRLSCALRGYEPCHNPEEVIAAMGYDPDAGHGQHRRTRCSAPTGPASSCRGTRCGRTCTSMSGWRLPEEEPDEPEEAAGPAPARQRYAGRRPD